MLFFSKTKMIATLAVVALSFYLALPNVLPANIRSMLPLFNGPIVLGLDLQGGSHVLLEVDQATLKDQYAKQLIGDIRQALRAQKIPYSGLGRSGDSVSVRITDPSRMDAAMTELRKLQQPLDTGFFGNGGTTRQYDIRQDGDQIIFTFTPAGLEYRIGRAIEQSLDIVGKRINALGTTEPIIQRQGVDRILVQVPGLQDPARLKDLLGQTAKLQFRLLCDNQPTSATERPPADCEALPDQKQPNQIYWVQTSSRATVDGEDLNDAQPAFDNRTNEPIVSFRFNQQGALKFGQLTRDNVGRPFAIVLDNKVVSAPRINEPILGGSGQISGNFTTQEATDLAIVLRSGALPARLSVVEERSVGPSLGSDSIRAGIIASIIGLVTVLLFMVLCYGLFGIFAVIALVAHTIMILGIMSFFGITLTLPGIAGLVLGMGMAVDSNVLVYERIREEMKLGRSVIGSIETGFRMAFGTIFDSNVTTLIAGVVLFGLGSGPIRGFAVTLVLGILTTIFTAFTLTRLIVATWIRTARPKVVPL
ncbi:MAG TPA: protein translocase subunit SecD [Aestuariivirgaceae bacterium]|jgi:protein-export membrane protein SecD|nr:protein translocase subunit SecD [Aestuariivirgaceae bacterium]